MRAQIEKRLTELRAEYETGRAMQADLAARQEELRQTMQRIAGAIQVLDDLLASEAASDASAGDGTIPLRRVAEQ